jgi:hypothetical protein
VLAAIISGGVSSLVANLVAATFLIMERYEFKGVNAPLGRERIPSLGYLWINSRIDSLPSSFRFGLLQSSLVRSGPSRRGASTGAGIQRRLGLSLRGSLTRPICMPVLPWVGGGAEGRLAVHLCRVNLLVQLHLRQYLGNWFAHLFWIVRAGGCRVKACFKNSGLSSGGIMFFGGAPSWSSDGFRPADEVARRSIQLSAEK